MKKIWVSSVAIFFVLGICSPAYSGPPTLDFEGVSGAGIVPGACLVNPPPDDKWVGKPSIMQWAVIGGNTNFFTSGFAFSLLKRFEVGYTRAILDFSRLRDDVISLSGHTMDPGKDHIYMDIFHLKTLVLKEKKFLPAFAVTAEFKFNETIDDINDNLSRVLDTIGYDDDWGVDWDLSFSKIIITPVKAAVVIHSNIRFTRGAQFGLLGFSDDYEPNLELFVGLCVRPDLVFGYEFRQKPNEYGSLSYALPGFTFTEDDMWDVNIAYFPGKKFSLAMAYCAFGNAVNKNVDYWVFNVKFDF